jgi:integrase
MAKPTQLKAVEHDKRATKDIPIFVDENIYENLEKIIDFLEWGYKSSFRAKFLMRDKALVALLILTGCRISEALQLKRRQFRIYRTHILLKNVKTLKHGKLRDEIILPKKGKLATITATFEEWLNEIPEDQEASFLFPTGTTKGLHYNKPLTRFRANRIIKETTGKFPHWFRAVCENIYGKKVFASNAYKLKDFMGLVNLESTVPYVQADWTEDKEKIFKL